MYLEHELTKPVHLCDEKGCLNPAAIGWARRPYIISNLKGHFLRKKQWNYWCVYGSEIMFSATISHLDYAAVCFIYYLEYDTQDFFEKTVMIPLSRLKMPENVHETVEVSRKGMHLSFISNTKETLLKIASTNFKGKTLEVDLKISYPENHDTLNVVVPWSNGKFQFTAKHHCLPTSGLVTLGNKTYFFNPQDDFAVLDYGRGVWPRESIWNWGMASGKQNNDLIGLNVGGKWTDQTGSTENAFFLNGTIHKISEDLDFIYEQTNYMKPWYIQGKRVNLSFQPFFERKAETDVGIIASRVHQIFGYYNGTVQLDHGDFYTFNHLFGAIEEHLAKW